MRAMMPDCPPNRNATKSNWNKPTAPQLIPPTISSDNAILSSIGKPPYSKTVMLLFAEITRIFI